MTGPGRRFNPSELLGGSEGNPTEAELADAFAAARALEAHTLGDHVRPTEGFEDRVMAAIATEPAPRIVIRPRTAARGGIAGGFLVAVRDAWGILTGSGRPLAVRAQALGLLLLVGVAVTSLGGVAAVGVGALLAPDATPLPSVQVVPTATPSQVTPSPSVEPSPSPSPSETASPTATPEPTETAEPTETSESDETESPGATETSEADETPDATETLRPGETLKPGDSLKPGDTADAD
jgi:hypothetical protein